MVTIGDKPSNSPPLPPSSQLRCTKQQIFGLPPRRRGLDVLAEAGLLRPGMVAGTRVVVGMRRMVPIFIMAYNGI